MQQIERVWQIYGADKVWRKLAREGVIVAHRTAERLMYSMRLRRCSRA